MQQYEDPTPQHRDQWRVDPVWQLIGVILTLTGIVDLVIGYYPNPRTPITLVSIVGVVMCLIVLFWAPLAAAWKSGYRGFRLVFSTYFWVGVARIKNLHPAFSILLGLCIGASVAFGVALFLSQPNFIGTLLSMVGLLLSALALLPAIMTEVVGWREDLPRRPRKK